MGLDDLITEARSAETRDLDLRTTGELVELMNQQDAVVPAAVASSAAGIAALIDVVVDRLLAGGRLVYVGAGSSGRLAAVDASECESTFSAEPGQVLALLAGADAPSSLEQEAAEDDAAAGARDVHAAGVGATDVVIGVSASGRTPYVLGAVEAASAAGAATAGLVCVSDSQLGRSVEREIVVDGRIAGVGVASANGRGLAVPGFIDLQVNGFGGVDFLEADAAGYRRAGEALLETGVTGYLPTLITTPEDELVAAMREIPIVAEGPRILGIHLEGPFISPRRLGTHPPSARRDPDLELLERLLAAGPVRIMTLAPEVPGADVLIDALHARGVTVSCGHSDATSEQANAAFDLGFRTVTHLFNAMRPFEHREPGIAGAALVRDDVIVQIIADGVHLAPDTVNLVWHAAAGRV